MAVIACKTDRQQVARAAWHIHHMLLESSSINRRWVLQDVAYSPGFPGNFLHVCLAGCDSKNVTVKV
jgi:hypothetical protein